MLDLCGTVKPRLNSGASTSYHCEVALLLCYGSSHPGFPFTSPSRDLLKQFTTMELMRWASLVEDYGKELREGSPDSPATDVFNCSEEGEKRWKDLKNRVVEHVSSLWNCFHGISIDRISQLL